MDSVTAAVDYTRRPQLARSPLSSARRCVPGSRRQRHRRRKFYRPSAYTLCLSMATAAAAAAAEDIKIAPLKFYFLRRGGSGGVWVFFFRFTFTSDIAFT